MGYKQENIIEDKKYGNLYPEPEQETDDKDQNWEVRYKGARKEINELNKQLALALRSMDKLIKQIAELEGSKLMKFRKYVKHYLSHYGLCCKT